MSAIQDQVKSTANLKRELKDIILPNQKKKIAIRNRKKVELRRRSHSRRIKKVVII